MAYHPPSPKGGGGEGVANYAASHLGEGCAYIRFFVCVPKVFNKTNENVLTMCNNFLEVQQSIYFIYFMKFIFVQKSLE